VSDEAGLPQPGDVVGGKYRVERAIGAGGMGAVYKATNARTGKAVALKWLRPKLAAEPRAAQRFIREARASARVRHPNVVDIYDVEEHAGQAFLVLELLEGETLRELLRRKTLGIGETLALLLPAMRGVAAAHAQGVVHRDIKPDNLFITRDAGDPSRVVPKVLDFGISKLAADTPLAEGTLTATGALLGTPHYMSLEQLQGSEADARSDIYAFGVVLYECFTGKRPFDSDNFSAIVVKVATETPADPVSLRPDLPLALRDVVAKAMARKREERYESMQALIDALLPLMSPERARAIEVLVEPEGGSPPVHGEPTRTTVRRRDEPERDRDLAAPGEAESVAPARSSRLRGALAALALLAITGGSWWGLRAVPRSDARKSPPASTPGTARAAPNALPPAPKHSGDRPATDDDPSQQPAPPRANGTDTAASPARGMKSSRFESGWVYLGDYQDSRWLTRYFDGWVEGLPAAGARITPRGRSYVRMAIPSAVGELAGANTTIGPENAVEVLELARWQGGSYVWARVRPAW
jgi:serine/threonine-protein kinase